MHDLTLPPLPEPDIDGYMGEPAFTEARVLAFGKACAIAAIQAERDRCLAICAGVELIAEERWDKTADPIAQGESMGAFKCAAAIRGQMDGGREE